MRILLVEDDQRRYEILCSWLPSDARIIWARNAGVALGMLKRYQPNDYAGIMLDYNLDRNPMTEGGGRFTGGAVVDALLNLKDRSVPILVHSNNVSNGPKMALRLAGAGYPVTRIRMADLTRERFNDWLDGIREDLDD